MNIRIDMMLLTKGDIDKMGIYQIGKNKESIAQAIKTLKAQDAELDGRIDELFLNPAQKLYAAGIKSHGKLAVQDVVDATNGKTTKVTADVTKKVEYTQANLRELFGTLPVTDAVKYIDVKFHISEANYPKLQTYVKEYETLALGANSTELSKLLEDSRIVKYSSPKISLELEGD